MRVFITGSGRCGTSTCYQACRHITNFTCGHESRVAYYAGDRLEYPEQHIEVGSHLLFLAGQLQLRYPDAQWIVLRRRKELCVPSLASQCPEAMRGFAQLALQYTVPPEDLRPIADLYYDEVYARCQRFFPQAPVLWLRELPEKWPGVWALIGAEGDLAASCAEWDRRYNPANHRGRENFVPRGDG